MSNYLREMPNGDLLADPGGEVPSVPTGYARDATDPYRLHLIPTPAACENRSETQCLQSPLKRWWCRSKGLVNRGVCCRCQKLVAPFADPCHV